MHLIRFTLLACAVTFSAAAFAETPKKTAPTSSSETPKKTTPPPNKKTGGTGGASDKKNAQAPETK